MKVYLAEILWDYDGSKILGVFTTREKAEEQLASRRQRQHRALDGRLIEWNDGDDAQVVEMELEE